MKIELLSRRQMVFGTGSESCVNIDTEISSTRVEHVVLELDEVEYTLMVFTGFFGDRLDNEIRGRPDDFEEWQISAIYVLVINSKDGVFELKDVDLWLPKEAKEIRTFLEKELKPQR